MNKKHALYLALASIIIVAVLLAAQLNLGAELVKALIRLHGG